MRLSEKSQLYASSRPSHRNGVCRGLMHNTESAIAILTSTSQAMEHVLQNMNKLNRSLEGVIAVGNEFGAVEALWSQFENVMAKEPEEGQNGEAEDLEGAEEDEEGQGYAQDGAKEKQRG
ncbi:MAG: hypothetical protein LQ338_005569 [Usnochroma carphineum]|nr:MAG: hypothetical protein LQ338_005569 [Usnochroma carphineum]